MYAKDKFRACLILDVDDLEYAVPFRSNMKHLVGKVFKVHFSKYGLDFTKAIPIYDSNLVGDGNLLLKDVKKEYYEKIVII